MVKMNFSAQHQATIQQTYAKLLATEESAEADFFDSLEIEFMTVFKNSDCKDGKLLVFNGATEDFESFCQQYPRLANQWFRHQQITYNPVSPTYQFTMPVPQ